MLSERTFFISKSSSSSATVLTLNSSFFCSSPRAPIQSSHFGFGTHRTKFFTFPANEHYLRVFPPNPVPLTNPDGSAVIDPKTGEQVWEDRQGGAHAFFRVRKGLKQKMLDIVDADMAALERDTLEKSVQAQAQAQSQQPLKARL